MKIINLDVSEFLSGDTKIEEIAWVFNPAIETEFIHFNSQEDKCGCKLHSEEFSEDLKLKEIINTLNLIEDLDDRYNAVIETIKELENNEYTFDMEDFIVSVGLEDRFGLVGELEDILKSGWVITEYKEANESDILDEFKNEIKNKGISEDKFYSIVTFPNEPSIMDSSYRRRRYVYAIGPSGGPDLIDTSREFCRKMIGKRQLVWRLEDIQKLSMQLNSEDSSRKIIPRPKGANVDVFLYSGGANCRHRWIEISLEPEGRIYNNKEVAVDNAQIILDAPGQAGQINQPVQYGRTRNPETINMSEEKPLPVGFLKGLPVFRTIDEVKIASQEFSCNGVYQEVEYMGETMYRVCNLYESSKFSFRLDDEKRMVYSPAMIPNKLIRRFDNGEEYFVRFSPESIQKAAYKFLMEKRIDKTNLEHSDVKFKDIYLVESWIVEENDKIYNYGFTKDEIPTGSWVVGYKVYNDDVWYNYIKKGKVRGLSVEGPFEMIFKSSIPTK